MNIEIYAKTHEKVFVVVFVLIDLKREINKDIVFVTKAKTRIQNEIQK